MDRKPRSKYGETIKKIVPIAEQIATEKGYVDVQLLRAALPEEFADIPSRALGNVFSHKQFIKIRRDQSRKCIGIFQLAPPQKDEALPTWCGIAPFKAPCKLAGKYKFD